MNSILTPSASYGKIAGFAAVFLATSLLGAETKPTATTEPPKEYILFVGADVMAEFGGKRYPVVGANKSSFEVQIDAEAKNVPSFRIENFHLVRGTKLSWFKANINSMRATSLRTAFDRQNGLNDLDSEAAIANQERGLQEAKADRMMGQMALGLGTANAQAQDQQIADASNLLADTRNLVDEYGAKRPDDLERDADQSAASGQRTATPDLPFAYQHDPVADGLQLKCTISSPRSLEKAYLAVTAIYVDPRQPGRKRVQTTVQSLSRIAEKPQKVTIAFRGLPVSFRLLDCRFDLYGNGQEVPTNLSKKAQSMTEEEAYQHFLSSYLANNRDKTRPPAPLLLAPKSELRRQVDPADIEQVIYVRIDERGNVGSLNADEAGAKEVSPRVLSALRFVRFFPGLENGNPVQGRVKLKMSDLVR